MGLGVRIRTPICFHRGALDRLGAVELQDRLLAHLGQRPVRVELGGGCTHAYQEERVGPGHQPGLRLGVGLGLRVGVGLGRALGRALGVGLGVGFELGHEPVVLELERLHGVIQDLLLVPELRDLQERQI